MTAKPTTLQGINRNLKSCSVRFLFIVVTIAGGVLAVWAQKIEPYRQQRRAVAEFDEISGPSRNAGAASFSFTDQPYGLSIVPRLETHQQSLDDPFGAWLVVRVVGKENYVRYRKIVFPPNTPSNQSSSIIRKLPFIEAIALDRCEADSQLLKAIANSNNLALVSFKHCDFGRDFHALRNARIGQLHLTGCPIDDTAIDTLISIQGLNTLYLRWTRISDEGLSRLASELPECELVHHARD
jgi:hypothetical protein